MVAKLFQRRADPSEVGSQSRSHVRAAVGRRYHQEPAHSLRQVLAQRDAANDSPHAVRDQVNPALEILIELAELLSQCFPVPLDPIPQAAITPVRHLSKM